MKKEEFYKKLKRYSWVILAAIFILYGVFAFFTPLTPGSWLFFLGLFIIFGREATHNHLSKIMGEKWFKKVKKILDIIPSKFDRKP